ncbi:MAG: hypothetical protein AABW55_06325, partial [Thermoproteota archaeon]
EVITSQEYSEMMEKIPENNQSLNSSLDVWKLLNNYSPTNPNLHHNVVRHKITFVQWALPFY